MTDLELWEDVHDIMGAGHETTATTTATALYLISAHPDVDMKLEEELKRVLGMCATHSDFFVCFHAIALALGALNPASLSFNGT